MPRSFPATRIFIVPVDFERRRGWFCGPGSGFVPRPREAVRRFELDPHNAGKTGFEIARFHGSQYRAGLYAERPHRGASLAARLQSHPWT
jgi:hypothetical protein